MDILAKIIEAKIARIEKAKTLVHPAKLEELAHQARKAESPHSFKRALVEIDQISIIAEYKRRSPSKGIIREDILPSEMALLYEAGGARAISVLTEEDYFMGTLDDLRSVKKAVPLPVLRKDFIVDEYQLNESAAAGASAVLLIVAALDDETLTRFRHIAEEELGIDALVEVHDEIEMRRAVDAGARLIGVNNRNLKTFEVSLGTSVRLADLAPASVTLVSESGLRSHSDLQMLRDLGFSAFLIGESLMTAERPDEALRRLVAGSEV